MGFDVRAELKKLEQMRAFRVALEASIETLLILILLNNFNTSLNYNNLYMSVGLIFVANIVSVPVSDAISKYLHKL